MMSYVYVIALTVNILSFITGASLTWSSPELDKLSNATDTPFSTGITDDQRSWISSLTPLGSIIGPFIVGYLTDAIGRRNTILTNGVFFVICYLLLALGTEIWIFYVARFFIGLVVGGVFTVTPMYVGEIADDTNRGALGSTMNVFLCAGEFFSFCVGPYTEVMVFNFILVIFPCMSLLLVFFLAPETPQYLISKGRQEEAKAALSKLRGSGIDVEHELKVIQIRNEDSGRGNIMDIYRSKALIKSLGMTLGLVVFQQASGISAVLFYAQTIFEASGSPLKPAVCSIIIGVIQFAASFLTPFIVDRLGRKILLFVSVVGMIIAQVPLGVYFYFEKHGTNVSAVSFLPIICLIAYIIFFNLGYGPLPWAILGETFPINVKSIASSITCGVSNICVFLISKYFESISNTIGMATSFLIFSGFCFAAIPFTMFFVIETKGKNVDEIQKEFSK